LQRARHKAKDIVLRPYLQGYSNGVEHMWGSDFMLEQILAAQRSGSDGFLFWNPTMRNDPVMTAMRDLARNKGVVGPGLLQRRHAEITAPWCPATGNVFATPADRDQSKDHKTKRVQTAGQGPRKGAATKCTGACGGGS
jgi:hypothetical protein